MARRDWLRIAQESDMPENEKFRKRKYKRGDKNRKKSLRDHRRACMK